MGKDMVYSLDNLKEAFLKFKFCYLANAAKVIKIEGIDDKSNYY